MTTLEKFGIPAGYGREILFGVGLPQRRIYRVAQSQFYINDTPVNETTFRREVRKAIAGRAKGREAVLITS